MNKLSVLIVDDNEADRYLLARDLEEAAVDAEVFEAGDGQEALDFLGDYEANRARHGSLFPPIVIFLDINMPRVTGFEFLDGFAKLRTNNSGYESCVIMMFSSSERADDRENALSRDFVVDFVVKGKTTSEELKAKVHSALAASKS